MSVLSRRQRLNAPKASPRVAPMETFVVWGAAASTLITPVLLIVGVIVLLH